MEDTLTQNSNTASEILNPKGISPQKIDTNETSTVIESNGLSGERLGTISPTNNLRKATVAQVLGIDLR